MLAIWDETFISYAINMSIMNNEFNYDYEITSLTSINISYSKYYQYRIGESK